MSGRLSCPLCAASAGDSRPTDRRQRDLAKLDLGPFRLQSDPASIGGRVRPVIHQVTVDPDPDGPADSLDHHRVPFTERLLRAVGQVADAPLLTLAGSPVRPWPAPSLHVWNADVFENAPEI